MNRSQGTATGLNVRGFRDCKNQAAAVAVEAPKLPGSARGTAVVPPLVCKTGCRRLKKWAGKSWTPPLAAALRGNAYCNRRHQIATYPELVHSTGNDLDKVPHALLRECLVFRLRTCGSRRISDRDEDDRFGGRPQLPTVRVTARSHRGAAGLRLCFQARRRHEALTHSRPPGYNT
jgi:hypothetical protein